MLDWPESRLPSGSLSFNSLCRSLFSVIIKLLRQMAITDIQVFSFQRIMLFLLMAFTCRQADI